MIKPLQADWHNLSDKDIIGLLHSSEGRNSTECALFLEAARRIEAQDAAIASAVQAEREACAKVADQHAMSAYESSSYRAETEAQHIAAAIRARSNGAGRE